MVEERVEVELLRFDVEIGAWKEGRKEHHEMNTTWSFISA
jgi:hypothetical protein